jgi:putative heme-binding domain-containing protein
MAAFYAARPAQGAFMPLARCLLLAVAAAVVAAGPGAGDLLGQASPHVVPTDPLSPAEQAKKFRLPPGFAMELVASEPDIAKPMNMRFDARGRLLVTSSYEYPFAAGGGRGRDSVKMLEDRDGDGRYETATTLVANLNIPIGVTPVRGGVIVFSIPEIARHDDADGDGLPERRGVLAGPFGYDDTHGMANSFTRGLDGWIYACHGFRNTSNISSADGSRLSLNSGNTFRFREDGSRLEQFTWGQVNPFGLCFDPGGNIFSADCHSQPAYLLLRGAYYPSFGKPHDGLGFAPTTIPHSHGSTGICGPVVYAAEQFPEEYRGNLFLCNPVTGRINRDRLEPRGSSFKGIELPDFVSCEDRWFRPVDVQLGPDGALYVADFYNCIIGHYEVPLNHPRRDRERGRIWRIAYRGEGSTPAALGRAPDLANATFDELWKHLAGANLTVRTLATHEIVDRVGSAAVEPIRGRIREAASPWQRVCGLWVLHRLDALDEGTIESLAADRDPAVRIHLMKALAERPEWTGGKVNLFELVRHGLADDEPAVRRAAADALARHPDPANVRPLLNAWRQAGAEDTHLVHTIRMALRDHLSGGAYKAFEADATKDEADLRRMVEVSLGARHDAAAVFLLRKMGEGSLEPGTFAAVALHIARHMNEAGIPQVWQVGGRLKHPLHRAELLLALWRGTQERGLAMPERALREAPGVAALLLADEKDAFAIGGAQLAQALKIREVFDGLSATARGDRSEELRMAAMDACVTADAAASVPMLAGIVGRADGSLKVRRKAVQALGGINSDASRQALLGQLKLVPWPLAVEIGMALAQTKPGSEFLLAAVAGGNAPRLLLVEPAVRQRLAAAKPADLEGRLAELTAGLPAIDEKVEQLIDARGKGFAKAEANAAVGRQVFVKNCAACHRLAGEGEKIGPDLEGIGIRGLERLLEDLLDPSRNVDPAFRATQIVTTDGRAVAGLVLREEGDVLVLADSAGKEVRLPRGQIEDRRIAPLSAMPANVADVIAEQDLYHLLAYLLGQQQTVP